MDAKPVELVGGEKLQTAINRAALEAAMPADTDSSVSNDVNANDSQLGKKRNKDEKIVAVSPRSGSALPAGKGRPPGVRNKLTNLRDAVLEAFDRVGGADYLVRLAEGTQSDRAAFTGLVAKVLPTQINQQVEGGIKLELSWLGGRSIGSTASQLEQPRTQVLDLEQDSSGGYRIKDPVAGGQAADGGQQGGQDGVGDAQGEQAT